jgi:hypothetical protein
VGDLEKHSKINIMVMVLSIGDNYENN